MNQDDFQDDPYYADFFTPTYDCYEDDVRVPIGDEIRYGKVVRCKRDLDGTVRGRANANSMLDTITYEIEFPDGRSD
jgi:hypothetical protein